MLTWQFRCLRVAVAENSTDVDFAHRCVDDRNLNRGPAKADQHHNSTALGGLEGRQETDKRNNETRKWWRAERDLEINRGVGEK